MSGGYQSRLIEEFLPRRSCFVLLLWALSELVIANQFLDTSFQVLVQPFAFGADQRLDDFFFCPRR